MSSWAALGVEAAKVVVPGQGSPHDRATALRLIDGDADYLEALERGDERPKLPAGRDHEGAAADPWRGPRARRTMSL